MRTEKFTADRLTTLFRRNRISKNWAGRPLVSFETVLNYICTTTTSTGLTVNAELVTKAYQKGIKISDEQMQLLNLERSGHLPKWNYSLKPRDTRVSENGK